MRKVSPFGRARDAAPVVGGGEIADNPAHEGSSVDEDDEDDDRIFSPGRWADGIGRNMFEQRWWWGGGFGSIKKKGGEMESS